MGLMIDESWGFDRFADAIRGLPEAIDRANLLSKRFRLYEDERLRIYYAPFDYVNRRARLVVVGITPGFTQMKLGYSAARRALLDGCDRDTVLALAKQAASFAGDMRRNLISMLDELGLPEMLDVSSTSSLFDDRAGLLHSTSSIRYPAFVNDENYRGQQPRLLGCAVLAAFVEQQLASELADVDRALIVPLGKVVEGCLSHLIRSRKLEADRCLFGFPHPSGANGHRLHQFAEQRPQLQRTARAWFWS